MTVYRFDQIAANITIRVEPSDTDLERYVGLEHLDPESLKLRRWGSPADVIGQKLKFWKGDIIYGKRRAYQRKLAVADFDGICSAHAMVLRAKSDVILPELLPFFLQSEIFHQRAMEISVGSLSPTINWSALAKQEFPLPPVDEQRRIADLLWAADDQLQTLKEAITRHDTLLKSFIIDEYKSAIANYPKTTVDKLGEILMGRQKAPKYNKGINPRPFLKVINIGDLEIDLSELEEMDFSEREVARYKLSKGDILLTEGDLISRFNVGRPAIFNGEVEDCCFQNTLIRFRCNSNMLPFYTLILFEGARLTGVLAQVAKSTTVTHLGVGRFSTLEIPVPPLNVQKKAEKKFQELLSSRKIMRTHHENSINLAKKLINENLS
jgi:restriction endonuclease S subunit